MKRPLHVVFALISLCVGCDQLKPTQTVVESPKEAPAPATIYRYRDKAGTLHYTDDKSTIPKGAKIEETTGSDIKIVAAEKVDTGPTTVGTEAQWRARFAEKKKLIADLEKAIALDDPIAGVGEHNAKIEEARANEPNFVKALKRLRDNREELARQKAALEDLNRVADSAKVPWDWR